MSSHRRTVIRIPAVLCVLILSLNPLQAADSERTREQRRWVDLTRVALPASAGTDPGGIAKRLLPSDAASLGADALAGLSAPSVHDTGRGPKVVGFGREIDGVPVYGERIVVILDRHGRPHALSVASQLAGDDFGTARASAKAMAWPDDAMSTTLSQSASVRRWWLPTDGRLVPVVETYERRVDTATGPGFYAVFRSALDGTALKTVNVTDHATFSYRVYADAEGRPYSNPYGHTEPHPTGVPDESQPTAVQMQNLVAVDDVSASSSGPWLPAEATETAGNNIDVFFNSLLMPDGTYDSDYTEGGAWGPQFQPADGDFRAQATAGVFDYPYDHALASADFVQRWNDPVPSAPDAADPQLNAKIVNVFYMGNVLHDLFYEAGFNEAAGNAQRDNYGRGGIAGDPLIVHAGSETTFIVTPGDGESPVMTLGLNGFSASNKDAGLDWSLFSHEWTHYMVRRLVGGGAAFLENNQGGSLNEGWADFVGVFVNAREEDFVDSAAAGPESTYAVGGYFNSDYAFPIDVIAAAAPADAYFYGIRRWPYGASNPFTFRHIEHGVPLPGPATDFYDWKGRSRYNSELHTAGEIWAAALWDCFRGIFIARGDRGFAQNRRLLAEYLVAGMLATPPNPTYTEARDGLLTVLRATDEADYRLCRGTFAARGLGAGAVSPERYARNHADVVESFEDADLAVSLIDADIDDGVRTLDGDGILDEGETGRLNVTVRNTGFESIRLLQVALERSPDYDVVGRSRQVARDIGPGQDVELGFVVRLRHARHYDATAFPVRYIARGARRLISSVVSRPPDGRPDASVEAAESVFRRQGTLEVVQRTHFDLSVSNEADDAEHPESFAGWRNDTLVTSYNNPAEARWHRALVGGNGVYRIGEPYASYTVALTSPPLEVATGANLVVRFDHAYRFQGDVPGVGLVPKGTGTLQISLDDAIWQTAPGTEVFAGTSSGFPALVGESVDLGSTYGGRTVRLRFLVQSPERYVPVAEAWYLDNIGIQGLANAPFTRVTVQAGR